MTFISKDGKEWHKVRGRYKIFDKENIDECIVDTRTGRICDLNAIVSLLNIGEDTNIRLGQELDIMVDIFDQSGLDYEPMTEEDLDEFIRTKDK
jgi:hypothetical protein